MATRNTEGGASAPPNVLPFPQTARALRHYHTGMNAAGVCSLIYHQQAPPANVELFRDHRPVPDIERSPELAMLLAIYGTMTNGQRSEIRQSLKRGCRQGEGPSARAMLDFLEWAEAL